MAYQVNRGLLDLGLSQGAQPMTKGLFWGLWPSKTRELRASEATEGATPGTHPHLSVAALHSQTIYIIFQFKKWKNLCTSLVNNGRGILKIGQF